MMHKYSSIHLHSPSHRSATPARLYGALRQPGQRAGEFKPQMLLRGKVFEF